jgi:hypothetical protein
MLEVPFFIWHQSMAAPLQREQQLQLIDVADECLLNPYHKEMSIYVPFLKTALTIGHFIFLHNSKF